jgi:hypothetical protein
MRDKQEQLEWEARAGRLAGYAAWVAALLIVASLLYRIAVLPHGANNVAQFLPQVEAHKGQFMVSAVITAVAMIAFIPPLLYLYEVTKYRRSELPSLARILIFAGPILFAITAIWFQVQQGHAADQFVHGALKTNKHAEKLLRDATTAVAALSLLASVMSGLATILVSLNAMRAGLLSRFMGVLGIILGALFVLPLIASPVIQLFWLLALGLLFMGIWPGAGRGPAWESGEAIPWPSSSRLAPRMADANGEAAAGELEAPAEEPAAQQAPAAPNARKRRKKKARG